MKLSIPQRAEVSFRSPITINASLPTPSPTSYSKVLVAGATGGVGKSVVEQLTAAGVSVRALVRDRSKAARLLPSEVEIVQCDVYSDYKAVEQAAVGCDGVICATGPTDRLNPLGPFSIDFVGTKNLVTAAVQAREIKKFVYVTSIGVDDPFFPLNLLWGVLLWKKQGELVLQRSGLDYTIIRPGGLKTEGQAFNLVAAGPNSFGLPPRRRPGSVLRSQVASCCIAALEESNASGKIVELIAERDSLEILTWSALFASV